MANLLLTPPHQKPATVRQIARLAGVSQMTVSRALGNRPRISESTKKKVLKIAQSLGYQPDPEIAKLMRYLRRGVRPRFQSVLCGLTNWPAGPKPAYFQALLEGAERQAASRGYGFSVLPLSSEPNDSRRVQRMLRGRGVEGVLLLPQRSPVDLSALLDWRDFSVVAASMSVLGPDVNRVAPHHFANTLRLCRELAARGHRRIGLVIDDHHDLRVNRGLSAAVLSHARHEDVEQVEPLMFQTDMSPVVRTWFRRERPDAIVATSESLVRECARLLHLPLPGRIAFASANLDPVTPERRLIAGIDERPTEIGAAGIDMLAGLVERRVRGLPTSPASMLLTGSWLCAKSCP